jgi:hypothetical protein
MNHRAVFMMPGRPQTQSGPLALTSAPLGLGLLRDGALRRIRLSHHRASVHHLLRAPLLAAPGVLRVRELMPSLRLTKPLPLVLRIFNSALSAPQFHFVTALLVHLSSLSFNGTKGCLSNRTALALTGRAPSPKFGDSSP